MSNEIQSPKTKIQNGQEIKERNVPGEKTEERYKTEGKEEKSQ